jgi:hypothetical protein
MDKRAVLGLVGFPYLPEKSSYPSLHPTTTATVRRLVTHHNPYLPIEKPSSLSHQYDDRLLTIPT